MKNFKVYFPMQYFTYSSSGVPKTSNMYKSSTILSFYAMTLAFNRFSFFHIFQSEKVHDKREWALNRV